MTFFDPKEEVIDIEITQHGKYLMSQGTFKPTYYQFFDDNILYDGAYANISESQNAAHSRIKNDTSYIESLVLFEDINNTATQNLIRGEEESLVVADPALRSEREWKFRRSINYYASDVTAIQYTPRRDIFKFDAAIGDALLDSKETDVAPAWKVVVLNGEITSVDPKLALNASSSINIPQVNISVNYTKEIYATDDRPTSTSTVRAVQNTTPLFGDNNYIELKEQDPIIYVDEVNTELLTENFDIEVFMVTGSNLERKYFETDTPQVVDGFMTRAQLEVFEPTVNLPRTAVEYFFDLKTSTAVDRNIVCQQLQMYNKTSYYIDLDFDCSVDGTTDVYNDIYGSEVEPEICLT